MSTTLIKTFSSFYVFLFIFFGTLMTSCSDKKISTLLQFNCEKNYEFSELQSTKDTRGNFEMKIPKSWKKELFVSQDVTRLYFADTTQQLNETYIIDIGLFFSATTIDSDFIKKTHNNIQQDKTLSLIEESGITFHKKSGFAIRTKNNELNFENNCIEIYLNNKNNSYYIIKIDAYGNENIDERFCEALQLLDYADLR